MGYTHGTAKDAETRICTKCNREFPNTKEFFYYNKKRNNFTSICKECHSIDARSRAEKKKKAFDTNCIEYDDTKVCSKCNRELPNSYRYFPVDKAYNSGLRNKCRECDSSYGKFLKEDYKRSEKWSEFEDTLLISCYKEYTGDELKQLFPNRSLRAIESRASILELTGKNEDTLQRSRAYQQESEWKEKISAAKKEYFKTHDGWWKGKHRSEEQCRQMSERRKGKWDGDNNPRHINPLTGADNGRWKGGINATYAELRSETKNWIKKSIEFCDYRCIITGSRFDDVHHTTAFRDIVDEVFDRTGIQIQPCVGDYSPEDFQCLINGFHNLHDQYGYGACLDKNIHKLFHDNYGYTKFSAQDFLKFVEEIDNGKYDEWFQKQNLPININDKFITYLENILEKRNVCN